MRVAKQLILLSIILSAAGLACIFPARAATTDACTPGSVVYFVNGINTEPSDATLNLRALQDAIARTQTDDGKPITYFNTYNPNDGLIGDLEESVLQWARQVNLETALRSFAGRIAQSVLSNRADLYLRILQTLLPSVVSDVVIGSFRTFIVVETARLLGARGRSTAVTQQVTQQLQTFLQQGNRVVLVTHSQGNFVGNEAYNNLAANLVGSVRRVGAAVPSNSISGGGPYVTLKRDFIRNIPSSLAPNVPASGDQTSDCPADTWLNHNFIGCYLNAGSSFGAEARQKIKAGVEQGLTIPQPTALTRLGNIVATLTWQMPADVDLHGYEPNGGSHVFYGARQGTTAQLDRDDTSGTGPENIFVCGDPTVGSYRFGVNYYSGSRAQTAMVALRGGGLTRSFSIPLTSGIGSAGNNPAAFGQVVVTRDNQGFHYEIR